MSVNYPDNAQGMALPEDVAEPQDQANLTPDSTQIARLDRLVSSLYACVDSEEGFHPFLNCIREELHLTSASFAVFQKEPQKKGLYGWNIGYPPGIISLMLKTGLVFKDKAIAEALENGPNSLFSYANGDPDYDLLAEMSTFSRTWIRAAGIIDSATIAFTNRYQQHVILVLNRHKSLSVFDQGDMALLARLKKHIEIAIDLYERIHRSDQVFNNLKTSISLLKQPVAIFSPVTTLITASPTFVAMGSRYGAFHIDEEEKLIAFKDEGFGLAFYTQLGLYVSGETSALDDSDTLYLHTDALPLRFSLTPVKNQNTHNHNVLVEIFDPNQCREPCPEEIRKILKVTDSEARVCLGLLKGINPADIAEQQGIAISTVRGYIKSILQKNNFNRQVDLVAHLLRICS